MSSYVRGTPVCRAFHDLPADDTGREASSKGYLKHPSRATLYLLYTNLCTGELNAIRKHKCFLRSPFYGRACRWAMLGSIKT